MVVTLGAAARDAIGQHLLDSNADGYETGGALFGHQSSTELRITHAAGPGPHAVRSRTSFRRDLPYTRLVSAYLYADSGAVWIGEWHSHPDGPPSPSPRDLATYRALLDDDELALPVLIALIASRNDQPLPTRGPGDASSRRPTSCAPGWDAHGWLCDQDDLVGVHIHDRALEGGPLT